MDVRTSAHRRGHLSFFVNIGRWLGFFIAITLGAVAMAICLIAALFQASASTILSLTEEARNE